MNADELMGLSVVDSERGKTIGSVKGLLIDRDKKRIVALAVGGGLVSQPHFVLFGDVKSVQRDVLMVPSAGSLVERRTLSDTELTDHLTGRRVLTQDGRDLGTVRGYTIEPESGDITSMTFAVDRQVLGGLWTSARESYTVPITAVRTIGDHVVVDNSVAEDMGKNRAA